MPLLKGHCLSRSIHNPSVQSEKAKSFSRGILIPAGITSEALAAVNGKDRLLKARGDSFKGNYSWEGLNISSRVYPPYLCIFMCACVIALIMRKGEGASGRCL